ncbi:MAG: GatB/YqeY domain-containing protein [Candidatus Omnitrophica bacterium]|nr:GatB/YqeY domain-containing protein [Candidatus Omnitrophota bacterium]
MTLEEKILNDFKEAMKAKDQIKVSTLSFLRAQFNYLGLEKKKKSLDDADCIFAIKKLIKQHQDSIEQFKAGSRQDLADKEAKELEILKSYVPPEMSKEALKDIVDEVIASTGAAGLRDMGKVIKEVMAKAGGSAGGKMVSEMVKLRLVPAAE